MPPDEEEAGVAARLAEAVAGRGAAAAVRTAGEDTAALVVAEAGPVDPEALAAGAGPVTLPSPDSDSPPGRLTPERSRPGAMALTRASTPAAERPGPEAAAPAAA